MPPSPAVLGSVNDLNTASRTIKSAEEIQKEIHNKAMSICGNEDAPSSETTDQLTLTVIPEETKTPNGSPSKSTGVTSPASSTATGSSVAESLKENVAPSKKKSTSSTRRTLTMTYSPKKKRKRPSQTQTQKSPLGADPTREQGARRPSVSSSTSQPKPVDHHEEHVDGSDTSGSESSGSDDDDDNDGETYVVERIDGKQDVDGVTYYFIKWKGWEESANTWEPIEHLDGCSELLDAFQKREAAKRGPKRKSGAPKKPRNVSDDESELTKMLLETEKNMKSYGIHPEWPADKEPISVEGVLHVDGVLTYIVKKRARLGSRQLDRSNAILVHSEGFRQFYPELIIQYYEQRIVWNENQKDEEEQAALAAQMTLLCKNRGSKMEDELLKNVDTQLGGEMEIDEEPSSAAIRIVNEESLREPESETDTQVVYMEYTDLNLSLPSNLDDEEDGENEAAKCDVFGLPEDLEETDVSSTDSNCDYEEIQVPTPTLKLPESRMGRNIKS